jgi:hypothetical protein
VLGLWLLELVHRPCHPGKHLLLDSAIRVGALFVTLLPLLAHFRGVDLEVGAYTARDVAQVLVEFPSGRTSPVPVAVIDLVDLETRLEHEGVRNHRVVVRVRVLLDAEVLLDDALGVVQKGPGGTYPEPEVVGEDKGVRGDGDEAGEANGALTREPHQFMKLLPVLGAINTALQHHDHRIVAL